MISHQEAPLPHPQERPLALPVCMAWAKARGSIDELRRYIWNMEKKGREGKGLKLPSSEPLPYALFTHNPSQDQHP